MGRQWELVKAPCFRPLKKVSEGKGKREKKEVGGLDEDAKRRGHITIPRSGGEKKRAQGSFFVAE